MARPLKVKINETVSELEKRLSKSITARETERIQMIYWLKTNQALTRPELAKLLGRHESTITRWLTLSSSWRTKKAVRGKKCTWKSFKNFGRNFSRFTSKIIRTNWVQKLWRN
ncbi:MAG: helix-turn-helix domain-containing protein [Trichodesmium sp. MO_231.B1]|nr:helix-turn-helix domain-containing protein [Trichodesmium sp. MO_231.B1]